MSDQMLWVGLAAGELTLVLILLLTVSWFKHRSQRVRDRNAVQKFIDRVERARIEREAEIRGFIQDNFGLSDDALERKAVPIIRGERRLYQSFVNLYLQRDADNVPGFHLNMESAVAPYWQLDGGSSNGEAAATAPAVPEVAATPVDDGELARLQIENESLSDELQITMNTMTRMLNEYSSMFAGGSTEVAASDADGTAAADNANAEIEAEKVPDTTPAMEFPDGVDLEIAVADGDEIAESGDSSIVATLDGAQNAVDVEKLPEDPVVEVAAAVDTVTDVAGSDNDDAGIAGDVIVEQSDVADATVPDAAVDELLADVLGDADLGLDDLFDEVELQPTESTQELSGNSKDDTGNDQNSAAS